MADIFSKRKRSEVMSRIRSKDTLIERRVFRYLRSHRVYFQRHYKRVPGCPDVAIPSKKIAVFIDGDFWHGWKFLKRKKRLPKYWQEKISNNIKRDSLRRKALRKQGWSILRVWEHELEKDFNFYSKKILDFIKI